MGVRKETGKRQVPEGWGYSGDFENRREYSLMKELLKDSQDKY